MQTSRYQWRDDVWRSGRVAEGTPLLRVQAHKTGLGGSNPPFSAI